MRPLRSLQRRLALLGLVGTLAPLVVLVAVVFAVDTDSSADSTDSADSADSSSFEEDENVGVSPWVPIAALALIVPAGATAWWWSRQAIKPVLAITDVANQIQAGTLDRRIGLQDAPEEIQALADSFDSMLDRLSTASTVQRRLIEETSHELRTPLAALLVNAEIILDHPEPTHDDYQASAERTQELAKRLQLTLESHLTTAVAENLAAEQVDNDLIAIVERVVVGAKTVHPHATITTAGPPRLHLALDPAGVERAIRNLIDNSVRVSAPGQPVSVEVATTQTATRLSVTDHGPGIDPADHDRIFDRYYSTRTEHDGDHGIGLAVVKQVADAHGHIEVHSPPPGQITGTRITLVFEHG